MVLGDVILRGTHAARPAVGAVPVGTLYFETDNLIIVRNSGASWDSFSSAAVTGINQLTGDVTAGAGTGSQVATIANDAVTYAKMQNVSATKRILGRKTAGSGDVEECTLSDILDFVTSPAQGDILFRGASVWQNLAAGVAGKILQTNGAGADPSWVTNSGGISNTRRVSILQKADATNNSSMVAVGQAAATITGGSGVFDSSGFWSEPIGGSGSSCRISAAAPFTQFNQTSISRFRIRTPSVLTNTRLLVSLNEYLSGVNTDTPSTTTQRGIYVRYSTSAGDGGWVVQSVDSSGRTVSSTILAIATSTIYLITITVNSVSSIDITINGTTVNVSANIPSGINVGYEISNNALSAFLPFFDCERISIEAD